MPHLRVCVCVWAHIHQRKMRVNCVKFNTSANTLDCFQLYSLSACVYLLRGISKETYVVLRVWFLFLICKRIEVDLYSLSLFFLSFFHYCTLNEVLHMQKNTKTQTLIRDSGPNIVRKNANSFRNAPNKRFFVWQMSCPNGMRHVCSQPNISLYLIIVNTCKCEEKKIRNFFRKCVR